MGCCGKRRQALVSSFADTQASVKQIDDTPPSNLVQSNSTAVFRYTGESSIEVEGVFRRQVYRFSRENPELTIAAEDVALLRGYSELVELTVKTASD